MSAYDRDAFLQSEEECMESVYKALDDELIKAAGSVKIAREKVDRESYEDQDSFIAHNDLSKASSDQREIESRINSLRKTPYFAHIEASDPESSDGVHYYLSDSEILDEIVHIGGKGSPDALIPFIRDPEREISSALFHCYQEKSGDPVTYKVSREQYTLIPQKICDDNIENRKLLDAVQYFPATEFTADELLDDKLEENRDNPIFRNIIATLQSSQFKIIEADENQSFVVQGCAGSGKSQCLLHRLFFLRDVLSEEGWDHVLLVTPTQLFRSYSADLIQRYRLSDIKNGSITELYRTLLIAYDVRFRERQYYFEFSEEYLPDEYLHEVYDASMIARIDDAVLNAIHKYISDGYTALGIDMPYLVTPHEVKDLVNRLNEEIRKAKKAENLLKRDPQYVEKKKQLGSLQKQLTSYEKTRDRLNKELAFILHDSADLDQSLSALRKAEDELSVWRHKCENDLHAAEAELEQLKGQLTDNPDIRLQARYARQMAIVQDMCNGVRYKENEEYLHFLDAYCKEMQDQVHQITGKHTAGRVSARYKRRQTEILKKDKQLTGQIAEVKAQMDEYEKWIRVRSNQLTAGGGGERSSSQDLIRIRKFLSRIESSVFDQEVWNTLSPLKEKYQVPAVQVETQPNGHRKETKILYKSDLLFYLKIYVSLHPDKELPDYRLICIDEGQDLHKADYDLLRQLYPDAVFNVFGDTGQVLHTACGIQDWKADTGIETEYHMDRNYRNTAAIVDFCNQSFDSSMKYIGKIKENQKPRVMTDPEKFREAVEQPNMVVIVKNRNTLKQLCLKTDKPISDFEYVDTKKDRLLSEGIPCYSIFAAKGLEFSSVSVYAAEMTRNQKIVACTRAMKNLYYYE